MDMTRRAGAELFGTFWLTFGGCGSAVLAAAFPALGIGFLGVALAFGLTVLTMAYAVGHISGGHFNPAVTIGLWAGKRFNAVDVVPYIIAQVVGAIVAAAALYWIASGKAGWTPGGFAANGYGDLSPGKYNVTSCFLMEGLDDLLLSGHHHRLHLQGRRFWFCRYLDRSRPDVDPSGVDSGYQHFGQSSAQHGPSPVRRHRVCGAALAVLACADHRCRHRRCGHTLAASGGGRRLAIIYGAAATHNNGVGLAQRSWGPRRQRPNRDSLVKWRVPGVDIGAERGLAFCNVRKEGDSRRLRQPRPTTDSEPQFSR